MMLVGSGSARRRRDRRLRMHWRHERLSLRMLLVSVGHQSWQSWTSFGVQTAPEYVAPSPAVHAVGADLAVHAAPAPDVPLPAATLAATATLAPVSIEHVTPELVDREHTCGALTCDWLHRTAFSSDRCFREPAIFFPCCGGLFFSCRGRVRFARVHPSPSGTSSSAD